MAGSKVLNCMSMILKQALLNSKDSEVFEILQTGYRIVIQLDVNDALPKDSLKTGEALNITAVLNELSSDESKKIRIYFCYVSKTRRGKPGFLENFSGIYPVDYNNAVHQENYGVFFGFTGHMIFGNEPDKETSDLLDFEIKGDTFLLALEYMDILPDKITSRRRYYGCSRA